MQLTVHFGRNAAKNHKISGKILVQNSILWLKCVELWRSFWSLDKLFFAKNIKNDKIKTRK